jgi:hypothetical protein
MPCAIVAMRGMSMNRRVRGVPARGLRDVDGEVADPLEVGVDLQRGDDGPEIDGHRLVERQQREAAVVDLDVQRVHRLVADEHAIEQVAIAFDQSLDRQAHLLLREPAHFEQPRLELFELLLEMTNTLFRLGHCPLSRGARAPRS